MRTILLETSASSYLPSPTMLPSCRAGAKAIGSHAFIRRFLSGIGPSNDNAAEASCLRSTGRPIQLRSQDADTPWGGHPAHPCRSRVRGSSKRDISRIWSAHHCSQALDGFRESCQRTEWPSKRLEGDRLSFHVLPHIQSTTYPSPKRSPRRAFLHGIRQRQGIFHGDKEARMAVRRRASREVKSRQRSRIRALAGRRLPGNGNCV